MKTPGLRYVYERGYVLARRTSRRPKHVPAGDVILLRVRGGRRHHRLDLYLRPDEAAAIVASLASALWDELVNVWDRPAGSLLA